MKQLTLLTWLSYYVMLDTKIEKLSEKTCYLPKLNLTHNCIQDLNWKKCFRIYADGANAMGGVVIQVKQVSPKAKFIHCQSSQRSLGCIYAMFSGTENCIK